MASKKIRAVPIEQNEATSNEPIEDTRQEQIEEDKSDDKPIEDDKPDDKPVEEDKTIDTI
jgi:hypothetical protein